MGTLLGLIFYVLAMSSLLLCSEGAVYSTPDTALRFSQCLIEKISESPFFTVEDRDSMIEVADVMTKTMRQKLPGMASPTKALTTAFVTSMADVVILEDATRNILRKEIYSEALEQCSISSTGYADADFIDDALRIMTTLENSKTVNSGNTRAPSGASYYAEEHLEPDHHISGDYVDPYFHMSGDYFEPAPAEIYDYHAVQPSNPAPANFNPVFGLPQSSFQFSAGPSVTKSNANIQLSFQPKSYINIPSRFGGTGIFQNGGSFGVASSSVVAHGNISPVLRINTQPASPAFGGLNVPQMKESKVVAIPPLDLPKFGKIPFQDQAVPKTNEDPVRPSGALNTSPEQKYSFPITSSASFPQTNAQGSDITALESVIYNILSNSSNFRDVFHFGINQQQALNLARTITEQSLSDHEYVAKEAISAVSDAISTTTLTSPNDYAHAIARSLAPVLQHKGMSLFMDGAHAASHLLSNLPDRKRISQPIVPTDDRKNVSDANVPPQWEPEQPPFEFETLTIAPEDVNGEIFGNTLRRYLGESPEISSLFCSSEFSTNRMQIYFSLVKASLSEYPDHISAVAAGITSGTLSDLSQEELCSEYSKIISQEIAEILDENGLLTNANAEEILNRMKFNLKQMQHLKAQSEQSPDVYTDASSSSSTDNNASFTPIVPTLQPSFSSAPNKNNMEPKILPLNVDQNSTDSDSSTDSEFYTPSVSDLSEVMKQEKHVEETEEKPFTSFPISTPVSLANISVNESEEETYLNILTTAVMADVTDEDFTSTSSLIDSITTISEPTENTLKSSDYSTENYEDVALLLLDELQSALDDLNSQSSNDTEIPSESTTEINSQEGYESLQEPGEVPKSDEPSVSPYPYEGNLTRNEGMFQPNSSQRKRRYMRKKTTVSQTNTTPGPNIQFNKNDKSDDINSRHILTRPPNSYRRPGVQDKDSSYENSRYIPLRVLSEQTDDSTVYQDNPVSRRNFRSQPDSSIYEIRSYFGESPLSRKVLSVRVEDDDKDFSNKEARRATRRPFDFTYKIQEKDIFPGKTFSTEYPPVQLQPSFREPFFDSFSSEKMNAKRTNSLTSFSKESRDSSLRSAQSISQIATLGIDYIRSDNFKLNELCDRLNELAAIVDIPPLDYYGEIPLIDFLLHVLRSVTNH